MKQWMHICQGLDTMIQRYENTLACMTIVWSMYTSIFKMFLVQQSLGMCGTTRWKAAKAISKTLTNQDATGLEVAACRHSIALKSLNMFRGEMWEWALYTTFIYSYFLTDCLVTFIQLWIPPLPTYYCVSECQVLMGWCYVPLLALGTVKEHGRIQESNGCQTLPLSYALSGTFLALSGITIMLNSLVACCIYNMHTDIMEWEVDRWCCSWLWGGSRAALQLSFTVQLDYKTYECSGYV